MIIVTIVIALMITAGVALVYVGVTRRSLQVLKWWAFRNPYRHINDYMGRWWVTEERGWLDGYGWCLANKAQRLRDRSPHLYGTYHGLFGVRLHHIKRPDRGDIHDHPWRFTTSILSGWYIELDIYGKTHLRTVGDVVTRQAHEFHKIVAVSPEGCWTLFITGRRRNAWGFLEDGVKVPHKQYQRKRFQ
jgi:hypothetical protein